jgi:hypothetical protein
MKLTSPPEKWKAGDYLLVTHKDKTFILGKVTIVRRGAPPVLFDIIATNDRGIIRRGSRKSAFDFKSVTFEGNSIFRIEDDPYRTFKTIFGESL